jgi:hypothetical protein
MSMLNNEPLTTRMLATLRLRPSLFIGSLAAVWGVMGCGSLLVARASGASSEVLWSLVATFVLTFSSATAIAGIFSGQWLAYTARALVGYLVLATLLAAAVSALQQGVLAELLRFSEMYAAFFLSFFMISGVAGAVRAIASFLGL